MTPESFWTLIEEARHATKRAVEIPLWLTEQLSRTEPREMVGFETRLRDCLGRSYDVNLWLASKIVTGPTSPAQFDHFRAWLISRGHQAFAAAMDDPDTMASWPNFDGEHGLPRLEGLLKCSTEAYLKRTGGYRYASQEQFAAMLPAQVRPNLLNEELRDVSDEDARALLPKLAARFPGPLAARRDK